MYLQTI